MKNRKTLKQKAFTIIELIVVIIVIGVLFVAFVSKTDNVNDKAKITGVQTDFRSFYTALKKVGLENQLYQLSDAEFEDLLNDNLDKPLQFTDGVCAEKDPWGEPYTYSTSVDTASQTRYIVFASKGGRDVVELSLEDIVDAGADEMNAFVAIKQVGTQFQGGLTTVKDGMTTEEQAEVAKFTTLREAAYTTWESSKVLPSKVSPGTLVDVSSYSWAELKAISAAVQTGSATPADFGIDIASQTKVQLTKDGFTLVDAGTDAGDYPGFTFLGQLSETGRGINVTYTNAGGYASSRMKTELEGYYNGDIFLGVTINPEIKAVIKPVDIVCNTGNAEYNAGTKSHTVSGVHIFLPSFKELGSDYSSLPGSDGYALEGNVFDYYKDGAGFSGDHAAIQSGYSWSRSAGTHGTSYFWYVRTNGNMYSDLASNTYRVCAAFVI